MTAAKPLPTPIDIEFEMMSLDTLIFTDNMADPESWYGFIPNAAKNAYTFVKFTDYRCMTRAVTYVNVPLIYLELPKPTDVSLPPLARANFLAWLESTGIEL